MSSFPVRLGAAGGWLSLVGLVVGLIVLPAAIAGQPPSSASSAAQIQGYFSHAELGVLNGYLTGFVAVGFVAFALGLRAVLREGSARDRALGDIGVALVVTAMGLNLVSGALVAALVFAATHGASDLAALVQLHDVIYDGLGDVLEGAWIGAFSVAMLGGSLPRWIGWYGIALALAHWAKALGPFISLPAATDMLFGILILVWFLATVVALTRIARERREPAEPAGAPALA